MKTTEQIAKLFCAPVENVKRQFAKNAAQLRALAAKAGAGKHRGKTSEQWLSLADIAERKSK